MTKPAAFSVELARKRAQTLFAALPPAIHELGELFAEAGHDLALVGGPVRDALLGRSSNDWDFTTSARPEQTEAILRKFAPAIWDMGRDFGTLGAQKDDLKVEITTYRTEEYDPLSRKPQVAFGDNIEGDLSRRDFTVNAMAVKIPSLEFVDPFNGLEDLGKGLLRTPVSPEQSFDDDPLRMMRAVRFVSQLGFHLEAETAGAIHDRASRIEIVSAERVKDELTKLMLGKFPRHGLELMTDLGLAEYVLPELPALQLEIDEHHHHKDVYQHSLKVLEQAIDLETEADGECPGPDLILRLAALLHDIGKPATRKFEPGGAVSFRNHDVVGAKLTAKRLKALTFDKDTTKKVARLVELHMRFHGYQEANWTDSAVRRYVNDAGELLPQLHRLTRADVTTRNKRKAQNLSQAYDELEARIAQISAEEELKSIRPDLDGQEIMDILGLKPGREVGKARAFLLDLRLEEGPLGKAEATRRLQEWWAEQ